MLEIQDVSLSYHTPEGEIQALESLSLNIQNGEFVSIIGPSGCGKSTLLALISGLIKPSSGKVRIHGEEVTAPHPKIAWMPQRDSLFPWRTILGNVYIGLEVRHCLDETTKARARALLTKYGLGEFLHNFPGQLSGGMRQRVALIRTLAVEPEILLLDEPFSALDYQTRLAVSNEVRAIIANEKKTSILVTHDISEGISMADRVVVLTQRPASVKAIHEIKLDNASKEPMLRRDDPKFGTYFNRIWKELKVQ